MSSLKSSWPGVSSRLKARPRFSNDMTEAVTEMPRSRSIASQSERARRCSPRARTAPAIWIAPPNSRSFSVSVVLPASGCEMMAKVRRRATSSAREVVERAMAALFRRLWAKNQARSLVLPPLMPAAPATRYIQIVGVYLTRRVLRSRVVCMAGAACSPRLRYAPEAPKLVLRRCHLDRPSRVPKGLRTATKTGLAP